MRVAMLGLGTMGAPMAANLLKAGFDVTVHNRTRSREEPLAAKGAQRAESPADAARDAEVVVVCVSDTPDVEQTLLDAQRGVIATLPEGGLVIDCSTISPEATRTLAEALRTRGHGFVDAPVSGGSEGAIHGTLAIMCGGSDADLARALPVLKAMGSRVTHVGPVGAGQVAKAVNQVVLAGIYQGVSEGIALAHAAGADANKVVDAIRGGAAGCWVLDQRAANMTQDSYPLGFRVRLHRKDLGIALDTARAHGVPMPSASYVATQEDGLIRGGHGDEDVSAVARTVRRNAGIPDGPLESPS